LYAVSGLPCIALGKPFAVCNTAFAANVSTPVVPHGSELQVNGLNTITATVDHQHHRHQLHYFFLYFSQFLERNIKESLADNGSNEI